MLLCFALAVGRAGRARRADGRQAQHSRPNGGVAVVSGLGVYARGGRGLLGCLALGRNDGIVLFDLLGQRLVGKVFAAAFTVPVGASLRL